MLIEQLWVIVLTLVIAGGLMSFMIVSLHQENATTSTSVASDRAAQGLQQLNRDLTQAQNIPDSSASTGNDTPVVISYSANSFSVAFYLPGSNSTAPGSLVTWSCTAQSGTVLGSCTRTLGTVTATEIPGVISASITPVGSTGSTLASCAGDPNGTGTWLAACRNVTQAGSPQAIFPSSVSLSLQVAFVSQNDASGTSTVPGTTNGASFNTSIQLRNY